MPCSGRTVFSLCLVGVGAFAVASAWSWPFKTGFFPLAVSLPLVVLAAVHVVLDARDGGDLPTRAVQDRHLAGGVPEAVAERRAAALFGWIGGFVVLVALVGFAVAVPVFLALYLGFRSGAGWRQVIVLTAGAWACFYGLFHWILKRPFDAGWIGTWLGW